MRHIQNPVYYRIFRHILILFRHIQVYCVVVYLEPCATLAYSGPCHMHNPSMFRTQYIFRTL